jgi:hypothetical protein
MVNRGGIEITNNDSAQSVGVICLSGVTAPTTEPYSAGRIITSYGTTPLLPASSSIRIYVKTQTGPQYSGGALILNEWA